MARQRTWLRGTAIGLGLCLPAVALMAAILLVRASPLDSARLIGAAQSQAHFTVLAQRAITREVNAERHPLWKDLSLPERARRFAMMIRQLATPSAATTSTAANFIGNRTLITSSTGNGIGLQRQNNCSLTLYDAKYSFSSVYGVQLAARATNYEQTLHAEAGLTTPSDVFAHGCADPTLGLGMKRSAFLGKTTQGTSLLAGVFYDPTANDYALYYATINPSATTAQTSTADLSMPGINAIAVGDLNGDGIADVVGVSPTSGSIGIWLARSDGTLGAPTFYPVAGAAAVEAAVVADVTGDGKADVVVATCTVIAPDCSGASGQEQITVFPGKGDGTLGTPQAPLVLPAAAPSLGSLIAADLRGTGHPDLVGSNGLVLFNDGTGHFSMGPAAFASSIASAATSNAGVQLAAGDFNGDGKVDLAVSNGATVQLFLGNGDGTFTAGPRYASINDVGRITATDLDGDGNLDLYVGEANGGSFTGDQFAPNQAYVLMGNGDGSFRGAPSEPFVYTPGSAMDLNGDQFMDIVGVSATGFTAYLGDGKGGFTAQPTLPLSPVTIAGQSVPVNGSVESYALGDVNGDGVPDLVYIVAGFTVQNPTTLVQTPGVFMALGTGHGQFAAPTFYPVPSTLASPDYDINWSISNVHLADLNHDGKVDLVYSYATTSTTQNANIVGTVAQLGNGDGSFQTPRVIQSVSTPVGSSQLPKPASVALIADLNHDSYPDLVFLTSTGTIDPTLSTRVDQIQVALGHGDGTFGALTTVTGPTIMVNSFGDAIAPSIAVGDMNGDGNPDLIALGSSSTYNVQLAVILGNGDGTFRQPILTDYAAQYLNNDQGIAVGDFNGDGKLDVAISDPYSSTDSGLSLGNGDGTVQTIAGANGAMPLQTINVAVAGPGLATDLNGDHQADLIFGSTVLLSAGTTANATPSTTTLSVAPSPAPAGGTVTLTATVVAAGASGTPSGTVRFFDGSTALGSAALAASGSATYTTSTLAAGTHSLTANYPGDASFAPSTSPAYSLVVTAAAPAFTLTANPSSGTAAPGTAAGTTLTLTPTGGFTGSVALTCTGLPVGASCVFASPSVALDGSAVSDKLSVDTALPVAQAAASPFGIGRSPGLPIGTLLALIAPGFARRRRRRPLGRPDRRLGGPLLVMLCSSLLVGCGGGGGASAPTPSGGTPAGTYAIVVTATSGSVTQSATYTLTVN